MDRQTAETLIQVIAILGYIFSVVLFFIGVTTFFGNRFIASFVPELGRTLIGNILYVVVLLILGLAVFQFLVSKDIWQHKNWARTAQIVVSVFVAILNFPVGTILSACIIYVLAFDKTSTTLFK